MGFAINVGVLMFDEFWNAPPGLPDATGVLGVEFLKF